MRVHVINMDKDVDRWKRVNGRLLAKGYEPVRAQGVDVTKIDTSSYYTGSANNSVIGCALSHINLMKGFLKTEDPYMIVAEDDVVPYESSTRLANMIEKEGRRLYEFDIIHLGCEIGCCDKSSLLESSMEYLFTCKNNTKDSELVPIGVFLGTHMYLITRNGAKKIVGSIGNDMSRHIDHRISAIENIQMATTRTRFAGAELAGVCTDSNNIRVPWVFPKWMWCWTDNVRITPFRTFGYFLFVPAVTSPVEITLFDVCLFVCVVMSFKYAFNVFKRQK